MQEELQNLSATVVSTPKTIFLDGSGLQMTLTLGFLCEHLKKIVVHKSHRHHLMLDLVVNELKRLLADTSQLATVELSHKLTRPKTLQRRRPTQPIIIQWQLAGERPVDHSFHSKLEWQLKRLSMANEIEILLNLPIGKVRVCLARQSSFGITQSPSFGTRLFFLPHPRLMVGGVAASIIPGLAPMISSFVVQPMESPIFEHIYSRDLQRVQQAFTNGTARPNDRDEYGRSLIWVSVANDIISCALINLQYALFFYDHELIELLLREGADPFDCDSEGGNALICFIEQVWQKRNKCFSTSDIGSFLSTTRRLLHICGADTARLVNFVNDTGQVVGTDSENTLKLALLTVRNDSWDILGAVDLLLNAALQEGVDIEQVDLFGLTPILSVTRNLEPHFYVPLVKKLLDRGADPWKVDNNHRGILHHIVYQLSACNDHGMKNVTRRNISTLIAQLITSHGCDPFLTDDGDRTPFDLALSPVVWSIWCDGLLSAGVDIEAELRKELAKFFTKEPEECTQSKYLEAVNHIIQQSSSENFRAYRKQWNEICSHCGSGRDWEYHYQPFDLFGSYLNGEPSHGKRHGYLRNHSDGTWCSNHVNPISCLDRDHWRPDGSYRFFSKLDSKKLSWRKYVAFRLWSNGWLSLRPLE
jgi:hypothetical protein